MTGELVAETTVQHVTIDDTLDPNIKERIDEFEVKLNERLNSDNFQLSTDGVGGINFFDDDFDLGMC